jgi:hypothetical protein
MRILMSRETCFIIVSNQDLKFDRIRFIITVVDFNISDKTHNKESVINTHRNSKRAEREKFRKRRKDLLKKINELSRLCHADIYLVMYQNERYYIYSSTNREA